MESGEPLPGANVVLKNQTKGASTDANGQFAIDAKSGDVLVVSAIGYQTTELTVGNKSTLDGSLKESASQLNEVVVVGYGTQDRKNLVGSVTQVNAEEIKSRP